MIIFDGVSIDSVAPVMVEDVRVSPIQMSAVARQRPIRWGADFVRLGGGSRTVAVTFALIDENMESRAERLAAAGGIYGNKELKLLYDTVTESNAELLDNVKVELLYHIEILLLNGRLVDRLLIKGVKLGEADG